MSRLKISCAHRSKLWNFSVQWHLEIKQHIFVIVMEINSNPASQIGRKLRTATEFLENSSLLFITSPYLLLWHHSHKEFDGKQQPSVSKALPTEAWELCW